ncbi:hypothetical protein ACI2LF_12345 [Kribbella sp. NPDC020789]
MSTLPTGQRSSDPHSRLWIALAAAITLAVLVTATAVVMIVRHDTPGPGGAGMPTLTVTTTATPSPSPSPTPTPTRPATPGTTPTRTTASPDATTALAGFFTAAAKLDSQLRTAATAINGSGPPWTAVTPRVAGLVTAADLRPVARTIPAGLPDRLRAAVILVYSDLSSRRHALGSFAWAGPLDGTTTVQLRRELGNGHPAAVRFGRDLADARALASRTSPVPSVPDGSRLTAEILLLIRYADLANGGCDSRGGVVLTTLPRIVWQHESTEPARDGSIGGIGFAATYSSGWQINLFAC